nr:hypothetical protein BAU18_06275 [Enterococcus diestrammenae]
MKNNLYMNYCLVISLLIFCCFIFFDFKNQVHDFFRISNGNILFGIIMILVLLLALFCMFSISIMYSQRKLKKESKLIEQVQQEKLNEAYSTLSSFKHDYINILMTLHYALYTEDITLAKKIYEESVYPTENYLRNQKLEVSKLSRITDEEIKSLILVKIMKAQSLGFDVTISIPETIYFGVEAKTDLVRLLSIFLDNSIEHGKIGSNYYLEITILKKNKSIEIIIGNSINQDSINKYVSYGLQSKKIIIGGKKGIGIKNAFIIIRGNPELNFETEIESTKFIQRIFVRSK